MSPAAYELAALPPLVDGRVEVLGETFGPAGLSLLDVDDNVWAVDHADPTQLVELDVVPGSAYGAAMHSAAFGPYNADALEAPDPPSATPSVGPAPADNTPRRSTVRSLGPSAAAAGGFILLAELADDTEASPLVRIAAAVELAGLDKTMNGVLHQFVVIDRLRMANALAAEVPDLWWLARTDGLAEHLAVLCDAAATTLGTFGGGLRQLAEGLRAASQWKPSDEPLALPTGESYSMPIPSEVVYNQPMPREAVYNRPIPLEAQDFLELEWLSPYRLHIAVARARRERWVRVRRRADGALLAIVPLEDSQLLRTAEALIPPNLGPDDIELGFLDDSELPKPVTEQLSLVRDAIRAGRRAARADRLGDTETARRRWTTCAEAWQAAGDTDRSAIAIRLSVGGSASGDRVRYTADEIAELLEPGR